MKIEITTIGEGVEDEKLADLMIAVEELAMRSGFPHVYVVGDVGRSTVHLGEDEQHPRSKWKREWAAGLTNMSYREWRDEDCRVNCQGGGVDDRPLNALDSALIRLYDEVVQHGDEAGEELPLYAEWEKNLFDAMGFAVAQATVDAALSVTSKLASALGIKRGLSPEEVERGIDKSRAQAAKQQLLEEYKEYPQTAAQPVSIYTWLREIRAERYLPF